MNRRPTPQHRPAAGPQQCRATGDRGAALVLALAVMIAMSVIMAALMTLLTTGFRSTIALQDHRNEQYAADGAVERTIKFLETDATARGMVGTGCGSSPTLTYEINGKTVVVTCTGEPVGVIVNQPTPTNPQQGIALQRNVVIAACAHTDVCNADTATVVAKVNFSTGADGTPTGAFIQSWSVTG